MGLLDWMFKPHHLNSEEKQRQGERLDAKRRHLRGKMSKLTGEIQRSWTQYRTWRGDDAGKKKLRAEIRVLEAKRKQMVKEMLKLQTDMKKLGFEGAAGYVEIH